MGRTETAANLAGRGLDFADFEAGSSWEHSVVLDAKPSVTGRSRIRLVGRLHGQTMVAVVSPLGREALSLISLRHASAAERRLYDAET